jgi:hypothetical protein
MKLLLENWRRYNESKEDKEKTTMPTLEKMISFLMDNPDQEIYLDSPKGSKKGFGGKKKKKLPFDYGEYSDFINPADSMGWDLIIVPSATKEDTPLLPVGYVQYVKEREDKVGNDKIIVAPNGSVTSDDISTIEEFFSKLDDFDLVVWHK